MGLAIDMTKASMSWDDKHPQASVSAELSAPVRYMNAGRMPKNAVRTAINYSCPVASNRKGDNPPFKTTKPSDHA